MRGEITLVLAGAPEPEVDASPAELVRLVRVREQAGLSRKEAVVAVAAETGLPGATSTTRWSPRNTRREAAGRAPVGCRS